MNSIRVCHVVQSYYPADPRIRRQAEALANAGLPVDVVCLRKPGEQAHETLNGVQVCRLPLSRQRGTALRYLYEYVAFFCMASITLTLRWHKHYDVIHVSNLPDLLVFSAAVPKLFGSKIILDEHDPMPELFRCKYARGDSHPLIRLLRWQERASQRFAHCIITVSDPMRDRILKTSRGRQVSVVMNLPDNALFQPGVSRSAEVRGKTGFILLYTGTVTSTYNLSLAIEALEKLRDSIPGLRLRIVGDGDQIDSLRQLSRERNVADMVDFTGQVAFDRIPDLIESSDVGISTLRRDAMSDLFFTTKAAEYGIMGLPSIIARTEAASGYYPDGVVRMYEPDNVESFCKAVLELYENPQLREDMSRKAMELGARSNWSTEKTKYIDLISNLCGKSVSHTSDGE